MQTSGLKPAMELLGRTNWVISADHGMHQLMTYSLQLSQSLGGALQALLAVWLVKLYLAWLESTFLSLLLSSRRQIRLGHPHLAEKTEEDGMCPALRRMTPCWPLLCVCFNKGKEDAVLFSVFFFFFFIISEFLIQVKKCINAIMIPLSRFSSMFLFWWIQCFTTFIFVYIILT